LKRSIGQPEKEAFQVGERAVHGGLAERHGLNIGGLTGPIAPPRAGTMVVGLVYVSLYAFFAGWLFGAVRNAMARASAL